MAEVQSNLTKYSKSEQIVVYMDHREDPAIEHFLRKLGASVLVKSLEIGDYVVSDRAVIERKTRNDFESSIIDGRLFDQVILLKGTYERVIYIIEGSSFTERIHRKALLAAISSLILNHGVSVFFTPNMKGTAEIIYSLAAKEQLESKHTVLIKKPQKSKNPDLQLLYVVSAIPMIGEKTAMALLNKFKTLSALFSANERELREVQGVGKKKAKEIAEFFRREWKGNLS